jgi:hypothetical protein
MAAAVREAGDWGPAADWIEEVGGDEATARRVRTLAARDEVQGWANVQPLVTADGQAEVYQAFRNGFVHRVVATGRHLAALHQLCRREPVAEVLVCGPLWMEVDGPRFTDHSDPERLETTRWYDFRAQIPGWPGGGIVTAQEVRSSFAQAAALRGGYVELMRPTVDYFARRCRPESLLAEPLVPPGPRVEWAGTGDSFFRPYPQGTSAFMPEVREAVRRWDRIARWHASHPDGLVDVSGFDYPYSVVPRGAVADRGGYTLMGVALEHSTVRS